MKNFYLNHISKVRLTFLLVIFLTLATTGKVNAQTIRYVMTSQSGTGNGSSWANASNDLQAMITASTSGDEVWVAAGTYKPTRDPFGNTNPFDPREKTFYLSSGVKIYGGFAGTESTLNQRNPTINLTTLSGDFIGNDVVTGSGSTLSIANNGENVYHVVLTVNDNSTTLIDGFTIKGGNGNGSGNMYVEGKPINKAFGGGIMSNTSSISVTGCIVTGNYSSLNGGGICAIECPVALSVSFCTISLNSGGPGGGIYVISSSVNLSSCTLSGNKGTEGGGITLFFSTMGQTNCLITGNSANYGSGVDLSNSSTGTLVNCTIAGNGPAFSGGAVYNYNSSALTMANCILWGNNATLSPGIYISGSTVNATYSDIQGDAMFPGTGNVFANPIFVNSTNWHLVPGSPCIDSGTGSGAPANDLDGNPRPYPGTAVDMGAYEYQAVPVTCYADTDGDGYGDPNSPQGFTGSCGPGYVSNNLDCDDSNPDINPLTEWYLDADNDDYSTGPPVVQCDPPGPGYEYTGLATGEDCDDSNPEISPMTTWYEDFDEDGYHNGIYYVQCESPGYGYRYNGLIGDGDCDDNNWDINPATHWYLDTDGDQYGEGSGIVQCTYPGPGYYYLDLLGSGDCNDDNSAVFPGAQEVANGIDDNCNGQSDEETTISPAILASGPTTFCQGGSVTLNVATGDNALQLNGANQYMITPNLKPLFTSTSVTIEMWFLANGEGVIASELGQPVINNEWHDSQIEILSNGHVWVKVWPLANVDLGSVSFGTWHHVAVRYNEANHILDGALDGVPSVSSVTGVREVAGEQYWAFGATDGTNMGSGAWLNGQIDEIRVWNRAVGNAQILQNYLHTIPANSSGLVSYYKLDETSGTLAYDATETSNSASLVNSPVWVIPSGKPLSGSVLWSTGATTRSINVTSGGSYTATVTVSAACSGTTAPVDVTATAIPNVSTGDFGQNQWIVYAWNAGSASSSTGTSWNTNFSGYYTDPNLDFNSINYWDMNGSPSGATGYTGCAVAADNHSFSAKRQGFPCGYYRLDVPGHDDEAQLWINGTMVWNHDGCCDAHSGVWAGWLGSDDKVDFRITEGIGQSYGHLAFTLFDGTVPPVTTGNSLSFDGADDHIAISPCGSATPLVNGGDAITVEYWFRGSNAQSAVRLQPDGSNYIVAAHQNNIHILSNDGGLAGVSAGTGFNDGNWHHMAFSWQRNTVNGFKSYLDGQLVDQRNSSDNPLPVISSGLSIGSLFGNQQLMQGSLDEVRIWNIARTQSQIQAGMCSLSLPQTGLELYYSFDHGTAGGDNSTINAIVNLAQPGSFDGRLANFALNGNSSNWVEGSGREGIAFQGGSPSIPIDNGDLTPGEADNTDFGSVAIGGSLAHTFTIINTGAVKLEIGSISITGTGSAYFSAGVVSPASTVPGYGSATFTVTFLPTATGGQTAIVHVPFSECSSGDFTFAIQGTGTCAIAAPEFRTVQNVTVSATSRYEALNAVTVAGSGSSVTISPTGDATFLAGTTVRFLPGTVVQHGGHLLGYIETGTICGSPAPAAPVSITGEQNPESSVPEKSSFSLFPNPTSGNFTLVQKSDRMYENVMVEIFTMQGERVLTDRLNGEKSREFNLASFSAGLYFVRIMSENHSETVKLVKTR